MNKNHHASLRCKLEPSQIVFRISEDEIKEVPEERTSFGIIGQERAIQALQMALAINSKGYNVFATGPAGTGKRTAITHILSKQPLDKKKVKDVVYVQNFVQEDSPRVLVFPLGQANNFKIEVRKFIYKIQDLALGLWTQTGFREARDKLVMEAENEESQILFDFEGRLSEDGFQIIQVEEADQEKADIAPIINDKVSDFDELQKMVNEGSITEDSYKERREKYYIYMDELKQVFSKIRKSRRELEKYVKYLRTEFIQPEIEEGISELKENFPGIPISKHLSEMERDLIQNIGLFTENLEAPSPDQAEADARAQRVKRNAKESLEQPLPHHLLRYDVNVIMDNNNIEKPPVIFESNPDYSRLFGSIEIDSDQESSIPGHLQLRAGSIIKASGGYLILRAEDILSEEDSYVGIKRVLQDGYTEIRNQPSPHQVPTGFIKPDPVEVNFKLIIMGSEHLYDLMYLQDEEFQKLFKVPAEFDSSMDRNDQSTAEYISFISMITREEKLKPIEPSGIAALIEYGVRLSELRNKLSTQFSLIADIIREGDYWAQYGGQKSINRAVIEKTLEKRAFLLNMPEEKIDEQIITGELLISVTGETIGRVNGLAVLDRGYYSFGRPTVISAQSAPGTDGIVNVEREAGLSGEIHDKGAYIVESYIHSNFASDIPFQLTARICFEQSYVEVEGDSASSTEIYALLSSIGMLPLKQSIAVTGSVNQMGEIQPVGGVMEKIEGFYEVCKQLGINGEQGVIIPIQNVPSLVLSKEVEEAVQEGKFNIYAISHIEEGMEILTGMDFPSIKDQVRDRLREMNQIIKDHDKDQDKHE